MTSPRLQFPASRWAARRMRSCCHRPSLFPPPPRPGSREDDVAGGKMALTRWVRSALSRPCRVTAFPGLLCGFPAALRGSGRRARPRSGSALQGRGLSGAVGPPAGEEAEPRPGPGRGWGSCPGLLCPAPAGGSVWHCRWCRAVPPSPVFCGKKEPQRFGWGRIASVGFLWGFACPERG